MALNYNFKDSIKEGDTSEDLFKKISISRGFLHSPSTIKENKYKHIDCRIKKNNFIHTVDVKARKRLSREDKNKKDEIIWIELRNIFGYNGWLYGEQDLIAFEQENSFIIVNRLSLVDIVKTKMKNSLIVNNPYNSLYNKYTRKGRNDLLTTIKRDDLLLANHRIWDLNN